MPGAAWYRRTVAVPAAWRGKSVTLRIGGAHRETTLFVNGQRIGEHQGFSAPFAFDVTDAVRPGGDNVIALRIANPGAVPLEGPREQKPVRPDRHAELHRQLGRHLRERGTARHRADVDRSRVRASGRRAANGDVRGGGAEPRRAGLRGRGAGDRRPRRGRACAADGVRRRPSRRRGHGLDSRCAPVVARAAAPVHRRHHAPSGRAGARSGRGALRHAPGDNAGQRAAAEWQAALPARLRRRQHRGAHRLSARLARGLRATAEAGTELRVQRGALPLDDAVGGVLPRGRRSGALRHGRTAGRVHAVRAAAPGVPPQGTRGRRAGVPQSTVAAVAGVRQRVQPHVARDRGGTQAVPRRGGRLLPPGQVPAPGRARALQ